MSEEGLALLGEVTCEECGGKKGVWTKRKGDVEFAHCIACGGEGVRRVRVWPAAVRRWLGLDAPKKEEA